MRPIENQDCDILQRFQSCYTQEAMLQSGIFLKKMTPCTIPTRAQELWNRYSEGPYRFCLGAAF
jgi:hypothetical protein